MLPGSTDPATLQPASFPMAQTFFQVTNTVALMAWIALLLAPGWRVVSGLACAILVPAVLACGYAVVLGWQIAAGGPMPEDLSTLDGLQELFSNDWAFAAAWTHYLVFDMVVGAWIARDAVRLQIPWPLRSLALLLTFLAGPVGFLVHLAARMSLKRAIAVDDQPQAAQA